MAPEDVAGHESGSPEQDRPPAVIEPDQADALLLQRDRLTKLRERVDDVFGFVDAGRHTDAAGKRSDSHLEEAAHAEAAESDNGKATDRRGTDKAGHLVKAERLGTALDTGDPESFAAIAQRAGGQCWRDILALMDCIIKQVSETVTFDDEVADVVRREEDAALRWWMGLFQDLTMEQITAAYLMAYGRAETEISDLLEVPLHEIRHWREEVLSFRRIAAFWADDHSKSMDGLHKRIIAAFAHYQDPSYQAQAVKMIGAREKLSIDHRRTDQQDRKLDLDERRHKHEIARDRRMMGDPGGPQHDFKVLVKEGDVHIHATPNGERPELLDIMDEIDGTKDLPDPEAFKRKEAEADLLSAPSLEDSDDD